MAIQVLVPLPEKVQHHSVLDFFCFGALDLNNVNATRMSVAAEGLTEANIYFAPLGAKCKSSPVTGREQKIVVYRTVPCRAGS